MNTSTRRARMTALALCVPFLVLSCSGVFARADVINQIGERKPVVNVDCGG